MPHLVNICPFKALDTNILVTATDGVILNEAKNPWLYTSCKDYGKLAIGLIMSIFFLGLAVAAIIGALTIHPEHAGSYSEYGLWAIAVFCLLMSGVFAVRDYRGNKRNRRILDYLALFAAQGQSLIQKCHDRARDQTDPPDQEVGNWKNNVVDYLADELGSDYVMRFVSHHGLPVGLTMLSPPYSTCESAVKPRLARLNEFMAELAKKA